MSIRAARIKELIEQSGKTYQELERITKVKKSSLQRYASGVTTKIPLDVIEKLSVAFDVSQEYLMGWEENTTPNEQELSDGEKLMLELFNKVPEDKQALVIEMIRAALKTKE